MPDRRHPLRFVWDMDADGRFTVASDEFIHLAGPRAALFGRPWREIAATLQLDPNDQVTRAVATRETWSGITLWWPVGPNRESDLRLPIELSGLPIIDRDRNFRGYRGFGVCRDLGRQAEARADREQGTLRDASAVVADQSGDANRQSPMHPPRRRHQPSTRLWRMWCSFGPLRRQSQRPRRPLARSNAKRFANWRKN